MPVSAGLQEKPANPRQRTTGHAASLRQPLKARWDTSRTRARGVFHNIFISQRFFRRQALSTSPTKGTKVPDRAEWIHEIKHDGYRLIVQREGKRVRLFSRNG
jgi:ATP-dependent DNA ligase